jgi:hypothetical protein
MSAARPTAAAAPLIELLGDLLALQDELGVVLRSKLDAMKRADTAAMQSASARESLLASRIAALDRRRHETLARTCAALCLPNDAAATLTVIAERLPPTDRERLLGLSAVLRQKIVTVAETHRVITIVSAEMLAHYRSVFSAITRAAGDQPTYTRGGRTAGASSLCVLDAVG